RMYLAHTGADRVDVIDCVAKEFLRSLDDLPGVAGVLIDGEHDLLVTSDRGCGRVSVFRCSDEELLGRVHVGPHPNGLAYDRALVGLDRSSGGVLGQLPLPGVPDVVMHDAELRRLYVAIGDPGLVCSFDSDRLKPVEVVETEVGAHTIGWDPAGRCLYVFCPQ